MGIMTGLINILWIFLLPIILIISIDIPFSVSLKEFYVLISSGITHSITYPYVNLSTLSNHRKQIFLVITALLHLNILCFYLFYLFYLYRLSYYTTYFSQYIFLTGLYLLYITIPILINCSHLIKIHKINNKHEKYDHNDIV